MRINRDKATREWVLSSGALVLYRGPRSPWDHPDILREAIAAERAARKPPRQAAR